MQSFITLGRKLLVMMVPTVWVESTLLLFHFVSNFFENWDLTRDGPALSFSQRTRKDISRNERNLMHFDGNSVQNGRWTLTTFCYLFIHLLIHLFIIFILCRCFSNTKLIQIDKKMIVTSCHDSYKLSRTHVCYTMWVLRHPKVPLVIHWRGKWCPKNL